MLENLKIKLIKIAKNAEKYNLCIENTGSFSIKDETSGHIIITPAKIKIEDLKIESVCVIDLNGKKIEAGEGIEPNHDVLMHLEIYKERKEIRAIMHINSIYVTTFAVANKVIPPITYDSADYGGYIYVANNEITKNNKYSNDLIERLKKSDACLLENNGAVVISKNIEDILSKGRNVERVAEIYYRSLILNGFKEPKRFTRGELISYLENK